MKKYFSLFILMAVLPASGSTLPGELAGHLVADNKAVSLSTKSPDKKGLVVVFLSAFCPCSDSHLPELKKLSALYKDVRFVAVHANANEPVENVKSYFAKADLPFEVIADDLGQFVNSFDALKTPHAYIVGPEGEILFQGGVTDSSHAPRASRFYLAEALEDLTQGKKIRTANARALGCVIQRKENQNAF